MSADSLQMLIHTLSKVYYTGDKYLEDPEINYVRYVKIGRK